MNKRQNRFPAAAVPFLLWTVVFVAIPLIYILCMSFLKREIGRASCRERVLIQV